MNRPPSSNRQSAIDNKHVPFWSPLTKVVASFQTSDYVTTYDGYSLVSMTEMVAIVFMPFYRLPENRQS
jgi:hypothetical protein